MHKLGPLGKPPWRETGVAAANVDAGCEILGRSLKEQRRAGINFKCVINKCLWSSEKAATMKDVPRELTPL